MVKYKFLKMEFIFFIIVLVTLTGTSVASCILENDLPTYQDPTQPNDVRTEDLINRMTLEEKIEQMNGYKKIPNWIIRAFYPKTIQGVTNKRLGIPPLCCGDSSRGVKTYGTPFPVSILRGASWNPLTEYNVNKAIGIEAKAKGTNVVFAPTLNIIRHPGWGRAQESYSEDPVLMSKMGVAAIKGLQTNVMAQVKHFALNSIEDNRYLININIDERALREIYLPHFKAAVKEANVASVMSAYNKVNNVYMSENGLLLTKILKNEWGFDGFVTTDWFSYGDTINSSLAGLDMEMPVPNFYGESLFNAVKRGDLDESLINESVTRILRKKFEFDLFDNASIYNPFILRSMKHRKLALDAAREGIVLLKNKQKCLPLNRENINRVAVIGRYANWPRIGDLGSSFILPINVVTPLEGIKNRAGKVNILTYNGGSPFIAKRFAEKADAAIVVVALTPFDEGEGFKIFGGDRENLALKKRDVKLINSVSEANNRVIVIIEAGSAITMNEWINNVEGIIMAWYPGIEGGNAIADVVFGDINPSGKLPITFPLCKEQLYKFGSGETNVDYGYYHGYRYFDKYDLDPLFPFGYGLSYTNYSYENIKINNNSFRKNDTVTVAFNITNIGKVAGYEIAQLYVGYNNSSVERSVKDLKGFKKVFLEPGQTKNININISTSNLAYYNVNQSRWIIEPIKYNIMVGPSSNDLPLEISFKVEK